MATRVDLPKEAVKHAFELKIASLRRAAKAQTNPLMRELLEKDANLYQTAVASLADAK